MRSGLVLLTVFWAWACKEPHSIVDGIGCCLPDVIPPIRCDVFAQDCGLSQRCTWFDDDGQLAAFAGHVDCAPVDGTEVGEGQNCTLMPPPNGYDNCEKGLVCAVPSHICRRICNLDDSECPNGDACLQSGVFFNPPNLAGVCE